MKPMTTLSLAPLRIIPALIALCFASGFSRAARGAEFIARVHTNAAGKTIPYRLLQPRDYDAKQKYPLVVFFHGAGERGSDNQRQLVHGTGLYLQPAVREKFPCFVLAPQCPDKQQWVDMPWGADSGVRPPKPSVAMQLALEVMDALPREFSIDRDRLYVTGLSMGGFGSWDCLTRFPDKFAAVAPVCGGGDEKTVTAAVAKVPVWAFHSEDDGVVKVKRTRNMIQALRDVGGSPKYFEYFGLGHASWDKAYTEPELLPWMFTQRRGQPDTFALATKPPELPAVARWPESEELFPGRGPLQTAGWFKNLWRQRRMNWWQSREKDKGAVVFLGDSITQGWGSLARDFPNLKVANRGLSGDTTRGVRFRLQEDVLDVEPSAVVLLIGTNDLGLGGEPEPAAENIKEILASLKKSNPKTPVIVCQVMPRGTNFTAKIGRLNKLVNEVIQDDAQFIRCDTWSLFANEQGGAKKEEFPDLLHPNASGYGKWTEALKPIFARLKLVK